MILEIVLTPLFAASKMAANAEVYPRVVEKVVMNVKGTKFPDAWRNAARDYFFPPYQHTPSVL